MQSLVLVLALAHGLDVGLEPLLLAVEVLDLGLGADHVDGEGPFGLGGRLDRGRLRQRPPPMGQLGQCDVFGGEIQEPLLLGGVGLHAVNLPADGGPPGSPAGQSPDDAACAVHGSVRTADTATSTRPSRSRRRRSAALGSHGHSEA